MEATQAVVAVAGMLTGVLIAWAIAWGVVQHARAQVHGKPADPALAGDVAALRDQMEGLQQQLLEAHDRLDLAERMLSQGRVPDQLPRG